MAENHNQKKNNFKHKSKDGRKKSKPALNSKTGNKNTPADRKRDTLGKGGRQTIMSYGTRTDEGQGKKPASGKTGQEENRGRKASSYHARGDEDRGRKASAYHARGDEDRGRKASAYHARGDEDRGRKASAYHAGGNEDRGRKASAYHARGDESRENRTSFYEARKDGVRGKGLYSYGARRNDSNGRNLTIDRTGKEEGRFHKSSISREDIRENSGNGQFPGEGRGGNRSSKRGKSACPHDKKCGGCQYQYLPYEMTLIIKQKAAEEQLSPFCKLQQIIGMENPMYYRNKVSAAYGRDNHGHYISGIYEGNSHKIVSVEKCLIEDELAGEITRTIRGMLKSFKIKTFDEDTGYGFLRHVLVRVGKKSGQVMVVLVARSPILPSKNQFVKVLREKHPEITTIVLNVNERHTSMVLGNRNIVLYGKGYIEDELCGCTFRISPNSFYQINPVQTEKLYKKAIEMAGLSGKERIIDAYCGIGTIGIIASRYVKEVISVELNKDAVRDAIQNSKLNSCKNITFYQADAGEFLSNMAEQGEKADVIFMDPPRTGSDEAFLTSVVKLSPKKIVYISCAIDTLARDLAVLEKKGYKVETGCPVDMFPMTEHVECIVLMSRVDK